MRLAGQTKQIMWDSMMTCFWDLCVLIYQPVRPNGALWQRSAPLGELVQWLLVFVKMALVVKTSCTLQITITYFGIYFLSWFSGP